MRINLPPILTRRFDHPLKPVALFLPLGLLLSTASLLAHPRGILAVILLLLAGIFAWTLIEYILHRFVFHLTQGKEPWKTLASGLHMEHHRTANTAGLILAPPLGGLVYGILVYGVFVLLTWSPSASALLEAGVFVGYLIYEWTHFMAHRFHPRSGWGKYLKAYHLSHHFKNPRHAFGVTSPFWDLVFHTRP